MKKLLLKLSTVTLFISPLASITSCSVFKHDSSPTISGVVKFKKDEYYVLKGQITSIDVDNYFSISAKGFTTYISVTSDDNDIASHVENEDSKRNSSISIQGLSEGQTTITVDYVNMTTQEMMEGSFTIDVLDFSDLQVDWYGATSDSPIDIYSSGAYIVFGKIKDFDSLKNSDLGYDFTKSDFEVSLSEDSQILTQYVEEKGIVDSTGQICFKLKENLTPQTPWEGNKKTDGNDVQVTLVNTTLEISGLKSNGIFVGKYSGGNIVSTKTHELNFNVFDENTLSYKDGDDTTDSTFKSNGDGTYTITYTLTTSSDGVEINSTDFDDQTSIETGSTMLSIVKNRIVSANKYEVTVKIDGATPFSKFNMNVYFVFNKKDTSKLKDSDDDKSKKYSGALKQTFSDYLVPIPNYTSTTVGQTSVASDYTYKINTDTYTPVNMSISLNDLGKNVINTYRKGFYTFSQALVIKDDDEVLSKVNEDVANPSADHLKQSDISDAQSRDISKSGDLPFDVNGITLSGKNIIVSGTGAIRYNDVSDMTILLVFKDKNNNIFAGTAIVKFDPVSNTQYGSYIDTSSIANSSQIFDKQSPKQPLNLHDGLSMSTGLEMSMNDKTLNLQMGTIQSSKDDYTKWTAKSSNENLIQVNLNPIDKNGKITLTQVGQAKNIKSSHVDLTFTDPNDSKNSITITLYTSAFIVEDTSEKVDISQYLDDDMISNTTVSSSLTNTSLTSSKSLNSSIEFNKDADTLDYESNNALISLEDSTNVDINGYIIFDGNIKVEAPDVINTGQDSGYTKKIIFNGSVNFQAQTTGTSDNSFGCGILNTNVEATGGYFTEGVTFNESVNISTSSSEKIDTSKYGVGVISTGATSKIGSDIDLEGDIKIDSSNWSSCSATGLVIAVKSYFSQSPVKADFNISIDTSIEIDGSHSLTKAIIDDFAGYIEAASSATIINDATNSDNGKTILGVTDKDILSKNLGYGNAIYSRINGTGTTNGSANAYIGTIKVSAHYYDLDAGTSNTVNNTKREILKFAGDYDTDSNGTFGTIIVNSVSRDILKDLLGADYDKSLKVIKTESFIDSNQ